MLEYAMLEPVTSMVMLGVKKIWIMWVPHRIFLWTRVMDMSATLEFT